MKDNKEVLITVVAFFALIYFATTSPEIGTQGQYQIATFSQPPKTKKMIKTGTAGYMSPRIQKMENPRHLKRKIRTLNKKIESDTKTLKNVAKTPEYKQRLRKHITKNRNLLRQYKIRLNEVLKTKK